MEYRSKSLRPVLDKSRREDNRVISNTILIQRTRHVGRKKSELSKDEIIERVRGLRSDVVEMAVLPLEDLRSSIPCATSPIWRCCIPKMCWMRTSL